MSPAHVLFHSAAPIPPQFRINSPRGLTLYRLSLGQIRTQILKYSVYSASLQDGPSELLTLTLGRRPWLSAASYFV